MHPYIAALAGGLLIGISSLAMLAILGRVTGISGIFGNAFSINKTNLFRWAFLTGLIAGPILFHSLSNEPFPQASQAGGLIAVFSGLLVGFGTRFGGGCTSGHGVCGIGRLSPRSIAATIAFMSSGMLTVYFIRHYLAA